MARSTAEGGGVEATTLIFPKKSSWDEMCEAKALAKKRSSSANGSFSKVLARLVETDHMDRRASAILAKLDAIEDDEDLHTTVFHLVDGLKKRGILKRAMAQEDLFNNPDIEALEKVAAAGVKNAKGRKKNGAASASGDNVTSIGQAARRVVEAAGGDDGFKPTH